MSVRMGARWRVWARRIVVVVVVVTQVCFVVRAYHAPHKEFGFQMFPESSTWQAEIVRVTTDGQRIPISDPWEGYQWSQLVRSRGLSRPSVRHHADAGLDNQIAFLDAALDYVADHTPRDTRTRYLEAVVTMWHNTDDPNTLVLRSHDRDLG